MARPPRPSKWHVWRDGRWVSAQVRGERDRDRNPTWWGTGWGSIANIPQSNPGWTGPGFQPGAPAAPAAPAGPTAEEIAQQQAAAAAARQRIHYMDAFRSFFSKIGMALDAELEGILKGAIDRGYTDADIDLIMPDIQGSQAFKTRFPGFHSRLQNGYNAISIARYLELEDAYQSIMANAGMPKGFYDDHADFGQWIAKDVAPEEIQRRVNLAVGAAQQVDPTMRDLMARFYGLSTGDVASYFLDPNRALPVIEHQYKTAGVAAWAQRAGYQVTDMTRYEQLMTDGVTAEQAAAGYASVRELDQTVGRIAGIYGESYDQGDAEQDVFFNNSEKRRRIVSQEQATFSGRSRGATGSAQRSNY